MNNACAYPLPMTRQKILRCAWLMAPDQSFHQTAEKGMIRWWKYPFDKVIF